MAVDIPVYSIVGQIVDHVAVDEAAVGGRPNMELIRQAILMYEANQRVGTAKVKTRSQVSGSGAKPRPQKNTGRARHGSRYSPLWVGGGVKARASVWALSGNAPTRTEWPVAVLAMRNSPRDVSTL